MISHGNQQKSQQISGIVKTRTGPDRTKKYREQAQSAQHSTSSMRLNISLAKTERLCQGMAIPFSLHTKRFFST